MVFRNNFGFVAFEILKVCDFVVRRRFRGECEPYKFIARFARVEELARSRGLDMAQTSPEELDKLWEEVKRT